ncbi:hypothetical protein B0T17DRAFT_599006 [Bombardia bombarda]|uniref:Uncharacterized protein n=1 Tax=Bombardia bombarda TaxID=252184 RepID=A0AA39XCW2_9PEZI|nr:hypothetical protein B0T17DRAFT_599006 [Bombardia bombarda]
MAFAVFFEVEWRSLDISFGQVIVIALGACVMCLFAASSMNLTSNREEMAARLQRHGTLYHHYFGQLLTHEKGGQLNERNKQQFEIIMPRISVGAKIDTIYVAKGL